MAELTAEVVRAIVKGEVSGIAADVSSLRSEMKQEFANVRTEMRDEFANVRSEMKDEFANVRSEMSQEFANVRSEMLDGTDQILDAVQRFSDEDRDEMTGLRGRIHSHNQRIAKLERLNNLR